MSKFVGKTNGYGSSLPVKVNSETERVLDFTQMSIEKLGKELESTINSKTPMFLWSRRRQNEKIVLDNDKQILILNKIQSLRAIGNELVQLKAGAIFDAEYIRLLVADKKLLAQQYFEKTIAEHHLSLTKTKSEIDLINERIKHDFIDRQTKIKQYESIDADNAIKLATARKIDSEAKASEKKIEIIEKLLAEADFNNLTIHQTFLLHTFLGADPSQFSEFQIREELKEIVKQEKQAEANKKDAEADSAKTDAQSKKWKDEEAKKDAGL